MKSEASYMAGEIFWKSCEGTFRLCTWSQKQRIACYENISQYSSISI